MSELCPYVPMTFAEAVITNYMTVTSVTLQCYSSVWGRAGCFVMERLAAAGKVSGHAG